VEIIGKMLVHILSSGGRHEWRDHEVNVGEEEEDDNRKGCTERRSPGLRIAMYRKRVEVEVDETSGDENIDN
jgi:hypothetical protein